jgi:U6 snRNA-associated Sm-like protein LSm6
MSAREGTLLCSLLHLTIFPMSLFSRHGDTPGTIQPSAPATKKRSPSDFLKSILGRPARVKLNSGIEYRGILACLDGYMNLVMEQTEEYVDGQLKAKYGDCFIRGNNGTLIFASVVSHHTLVQFPIAVA